MNFIDLPLNLLFLFIFAGTLFSFDIGFTLKASQIFSIFVLIGFILKFFRGKNVFKEISAINYLPFLIFILAILPSLSNPALFSDSFDGYASALRSFFNYLFLQIIFFTIVIGVNTKEKLKQAFILCFISFIFTLCFGIFQQVGYYTGFYDPYEYAGKHSTFVDFYGPFLRISPGTFANEYGEIIQSVLIALTVFLVFMKDEIKSLSKVFLKFCLFISIIALIINFTKISWIIYIISLISLFFISNPNFTKKIKIISATLALAGLVYFINNETGILNIIPIIDRIQELTDLTENSAGVRLNAWKEAYSLFENSPFIGNGWGTCPDTHNVPLQLLAETGIIGFISFYFLVLWLLRKFIKMYFYAEDNFLKTSALTITLVFIGCILFDFTNHGVFHFIFWLTVGLGLSTENIIGKNTQII